jgi:hypothetical protein
MEARVRSAEKCIEAKTKVTLKEFHSAAGRWDIESMKIRLTEVVTEFRAAVIAAGAMVEA